VKCLLMVLTWLMRLVNENVVGNIGPEIYLFHPLEVIIYKYFFGVSISLMIKYLTSFSFRRLKYIQQCFLKFFLTDPFKFV